MDLRESFLQYFEKKNHERISSSGLVPLGDPTLLFTNAGMVQFKDVFTGNEQRKKTRATTVQKCLRVGGKHNDLENVGHTARHHTFFEMLGNFSFGDYFKDEAIQFAWEFLTEVVQLDSSRLYISVYEDDDEAWDIWVRDVGIPLDHMTRCGEKDNFWAMGDTGPCGPCSEIHYDQGPGKYPCPDPDHCGVACDCDRYLEIWNLVFMQFERDKSGALHPLPNPSIDTGMGLERLVAVVEEKDNNFDTSLFAPLIARVESETEKTYHKSAEIDAAMRVIVDHARAATFLVAENVLPGSEGRGYVLRRLIRRAMRYAYKLGHQKPIVAPVSEAVCTVMESSYPELQNRKKDIRAFIEEEESRFLATISSGMDRFETLVNAAETEGTNTLSGVEAFRLYDTFGFPLDLTELMARERGFTVDLQAFDDAMEQQRARARAAGSFQLDSEIWKTVEETIPASNFTGYDQLQGTGNLLGVFTPEAEPVDGLQAGESGILILDTTPVYAESGGQVSDKAALFDSAGAPLGQVSECRKTPGGLFLHFVDAAAEIKTGMSLAVTVDRKHRAGCRRNHTATHILQLALRQVLGDHVQQAGSLVEPNRLRFDFSHNHPLTTEQRSAVESIVEMAIREDLETDTALMDRKTALDSGAMAFFGEKYGAEVRVVSVGESRELCGGTHVASTGEIGAFTITTESGIASGVRRIEARTGPDVMPELQLLRTQCTEAASQLGIPANQLAERAASLAVEIKELRKLQQAQKASESAQAASDWQTRVQKGTYGSTVIMELEDVGGKELRAVADTIRAANHEAVALLVARNGDTCNVLLSRKEPGDSFHAGTLLKKLNAHGLRGGGKPDLAQGGGLQADQLQVWLALARDVLGVSPL